LTSAGGGPRRSNQPERRAPFTAAANPARFSADCLAGTIPLETSIGQLASWPPDAYLQAMPSTFEFCLPSSGKAVPSGPDWIHEIKYDGFRVRLERDGDRVRLITRGGYNWTDRFPWIVETARRIRQTHATTAKRAQP
jgi:hypothetical protein